MRKTLFAVLITGTALAAQPAGAAVIIDTNNLVTAENVLFSQDQALNPTQVGHTNQTNVAVTFSNPLGLIAQASGQSFVYNTTSGPTNYLLGVTTFAIASGYFFTGAEFNLPGISGNPPPDEASSVFVEALGLDGSTVLGSNTINLDGAGENRIRVFGDAGEQFSAIRLTLNPTTGGVSDLRQVRLNGVLAIPEPATWGLIVVGFGAVGYAMRRRPNMRVSFG